MCDDPRAFLNYIHSPSNRRKYENLLPSEQIVLYYFEQLEERTQLDLMRYMYEKGKRTG